MAGKFTTRKSQNVNFLLVISTRQSYLKVLRVTFCKIHLGVGWKKFGPPNFFAILVVFSTLIPMVTFDLNEMYFSLSYSNPKLRF